MRSLYVAATGMKAQQTNMDVIANNLANVNTTGYKRGRADFEDLLYQTMRPVGAAATASTEVPTGVYVGLGSRLASTSKIFGQGAAKMTESWSDISIEGDGFFQVQMPDGTTAFTRAGAFKQDTNGNLVTMNGDPVTPNITIPATADPESIYVASDGTITYRTSGTNVATTAGQLQLARFINPAGLQAMGSNLFVETTPSGSPVVGVPGLNGFGKTVGGMIEMSNVNIVDELVGMIFGQRAYEINSKAIQTSDQMLQTAVEVKR